MWMNIEGGMRSHPTAVGNAETGIWGGGRMFLGKYKDLEGKMERQACEKKDMEGSGEQEDRQTDKRKCIFSVCAF